MRTIANFLSERLNVIGAWLLALLWVMPLLYAIWAAIHPIEYEANFEIGVNSANIASSSFAESSSTQAL